MSEQFPIPPNESARLAALQQLLILDTEPEPLFQLIARQAAEICSAPMALLNFVDAQRQWVKAQVGLPDLHETPREFAFCAHTVAGSALFEVRDARLDPRFVDNPLVTQEPHVRYYAGVSIAGPGGLPVGALCVLDRRPRELDAAQVQALTALAELAAEALRMRQALLSKTLAARSRYETTLTEAELHYRTMLEGQAEVISLAKADGTLVYVNRAYAQRLGRPADQLIGDSLYDFIAPRDRDAVRSLLAQVVATGLTVTSENRWVDTAGADRWLAWTNSALREEQGPVLLHSVGRDVTDRKHAEQALQASRSLLERTGQVAGVGGWELVLATGQLTWSAQTRRLHEVADDFVPTLDSAIAFYAPEGRTRIEAAVKNAMEQGTAWDLELPLVTAKGRVIRARAVGEVERVDGVPVRLIGAFQDVTERHALQQQLRALGAVIENSSDYVVQTDRHGQITYMNAAAHALTGLAADLPLAGHNFADFNTPETNRRFVEDILPAVHAGRVWVGDTVVFSADRAEVPVSHMVLAHRNAQGRVERYSAVMRNIAAQVDARKQIARQSATLRLVAESIPAAVAVVAGDGRYRFANSAFLRWCGKPQEAVIGQHAKAVLGEAEFERRRPWIERAMQGNGVSFEMAQETADGGHHTLEITYVPLRMESGDLDGFVTMSQDVTRRKQEEARLKGLAQKDALTGLLNRAGFEEALDALDLRDMSLAVLYIDLDRFKPVNDTHGHPAGDEVLRLFGQRLSHLVRPTDFVARLGGDEFAIAVPGLPGPAQAQTVADKVSFAMQAPFRIGPLTLTIGASVGVAFAEAGGVGWRELVARADAKLLAAKAEGRSPPSGAQR